MRTDADRAPFQARIHRGAAEVGGSCLELRAAGRRLLVDLGLPLDAEPGAELLPEDLDIDDPALLGIVLSHSHPDHYGLLELIPESVPIYMGAATARILAEARFFT